MVKFLHGTNQTETSSRTSSKAEIVQRDRRNGWSCPWHPLQLIAWFFLCFFAITYYGIFVSYLPKEWIPAACIIPGGLYVIHLIVHVLALSIDPADPNIRSGPAREKNVFDRSLHAHVIENNHCHICEADVFSKSKHCSSCNKCVSDFDHHCKWLNTCVGGRNYKLFVGCISTAFAGSILMSIITLYLFIVFFTDKNTLLATQAGGQFKLFAPVSDNVFIVFVGAVESLHLIAIGLLGHLLCFHLYLIYMKISTYEFIVNSRERKQQTNNHEGRQSCEGTPINLKRFRNKVRPTLEGMENGELSVDMAQPEHSSSSEEPPCETTVKVMNEVSSKVAKRNSSHESPSHQNDIDNTVVYESVDCPEIRTKQHPDTIPETVMSSSAETLREIPNAGQVSGINFQRPSNMTAPTSNQPTDVRNTEQNNQSNDAVVSHCNQSTGALYEQSVLESSPLQKDTKPSYLGVSPSDKNGLEEYSKEEFSDSDGEELIPISTSIPSQEPLKNEINVTSNGISKKKNKKQKSEPNRETKTKTSELNELPPLVTKGRRPLPSLESYTNQNSAC